MVSIRNLSYSSVNCYLQCPRMFQYRYIDKILTPTINAGLIQGRAYHEAIAAALKQKIYSGTPLSLNDTLDAYSQAFERATLQETTDEETGVFAKIDWGDKTKDQWKDRGISLTTLYYKGKLTELDPESVEARGKVELTDGIVVIGYMDIILKDTSVIEHKLVERTWPQHEADRHLQPSFYAVLLQRPTRFEFHLAVDTKEQKMVPVCTSRTLQDIEWTSDMITKVWWLIQTGLFPPNSTGYTCSPKWCGYQDLCRAEPGKAIIVEDEIQW